MSESKSCDRCGRDLATDLSDAEAIEREDGSREIVCSDCMTDDEMIAIAEHQEHLAVCARCGREATFSRYEGWHFARSQNDVTTCPGCTTHQDEEATVKRLQDGYRKLREAGQITTEEESARVATLEECLRIMHEADAARMPSVDG